MQKYIERVKETIVFLREDFKEADFIQPELSNEMYTSILEMISV
jgi:hypothetical protein